MQYSSLTGQMAERKRNALEAAWLGQLSRIPGATATRLDSTADLYNYLLIDTRSGWQPNTSVVAQLIASLQHYINNILFGSEPGYSNVRWQQEHQTLLQDWQSTNAQYDVWAANVMLAQYPENYLSPPLRIDQTRDFAQMVSDLNQGPLNDDSILTAVQGYLNRFEEVANLSVVSGYVAGTDLTQDDYYFLGSTASKPQTYYWRKCAMHLNTVTTQVPDSWSEWQKVDLPLGGDNVVGLPRPVVHNNRLYVVWFERRSTASKDPKTAQTVTPTLTLSAQMAYLKFDGTWSTPQILGSTSGTATDSGDGLYSSNAGFSTLALQFTDATQNPFLYTGLYSAADARSPTAGIANDKAMVCALDAWMNPVTPDADAINVLFALYADQTLAKQNYNASVVNPKTTSQRFLQRAIAINAVNASLTDVDLEIDDIKLGSSMPTMKLASGRQELPNTIVIDTTDIKNSELYANFTPGLLDINFQGQCYGTGRMQYQPAGTYVSASFTAVFKPQEISLTITLQDQAAYDSLVPSRYAEIAFWNGDAESNSFQYDKERKTITALFKRDDGNRLLPGNLISMYLAAFPEFTSVYASIPSDQSNTTTPIDQYLLELSISNSKTVIGSVSIEGVTLQASTHCTATLANLDLSQHSDYSYQLQTQLEILSKDKTQSFGVTTRHAYTNLHFPQSLVPATDPMPVLDNYTDAVLGTAEFVHFDFKADASGKAAFAPNNIRLNTLFAKELVKSAQSGLERLFQWNTQLTPEPNLGPGTWLALTLPKYDANLHGSSRVCTVVLFPRDGLDYPLAQDALADQEKTLHIFVPFSSVLVMDQADSQGVVYQVERVYLQTQKTAFKGHNDELIVAFEKQNVVIPAQVMNDAPWGIFSRYSGFASAAIEPRASNAMDFSDANGLYFWELFYHTPSMVAYALQSRGQHADARRWQQQIFDPAAINRGTDSRGNSISNYWNVVPISPDYAKQDPSYAIEGPTDPDALAYADPEHFRKASYMGYVQTQIALGDFYYRQLTPDSLNQALQIYTQTSVLLGERPDTGLVSPWQPIALKDAAASAPHGEQLLGFEQQLTGLPDTWRSYPTDTPYPNLQTAACAAFYAPVNRQLLSLWDTLDSRRYNLRHNLDINGNPLQLGLFAVPLDPAVLLAREASAGTTQNGQGAALLNIAPYRYNVMSEKARDASALLSEFGQQLLQALQGKDERHREILGQTQLADLWTFVQQAQQQAVDIASNALSTLNSSLAAAQQRHGYYQALAAGGRSALESDALSTLATSGILMGSVAIPAIAAGVVALAPNIFGLADGGSDWAGPLKGIANGTLALGFAGSTAAEAISMLAGFERRQAEWQQQAEQANQDIATLISQISGQQLQIAAAKTSQMLATAQHQQVMATYTFLSNRFSNEALYQWLVAQLSALYYQAYDATLNLCLVAQTCWQYELGDFATTFIPTGGWNSQYQGLLAGETLRLSLLQMDNAWLTRHTRALSITRSFSLRDRLGDGWAAFLSELKAGKATFSLNEKDFDLDYPGHYLRQISDVSVTLPADIGPYQNVRATLRQTGNSLVLKADLDAVKYLKDSKTGSPANVKRNLNASQEIALSVGLDDSGTPVLSASDARYLPFEGTGAVSDWVLAFPNPTSTAQQQLLSSLNDVIVTLDYTARNGGDSFAEQVLALWTTAG
ncbi:MAG: neuraminidase-like domain-containing protein [Pseudomonas sp.]|uniref:Tc toxin subunit A-related protein n=1 Tax=Pseudomonas sp. TaxID=306 RepID=UPI0030F074FC